MRGASSGIECGAPVKRHRSESQDPQALMPQRRLLLLERIGNATGRQVIEEESVPLDEDEGLTGAIARGAQADEAAVTGA